MNEFSPVAEPIGCIPLSGRFDFNTFRHFRSRYEPFLSSVHVQEIRIDLAEVEHMDSAALGMLLLLREKAVELGKRVSLARCSAGIRLVLTAANFDQLFELLD